MNIIKTTKLIHNVFQYCKNEYEVFEGLKLHTRRTYVKDYKDSVYINVSLNNKQTKIIISYNNYSYKKFEDYNESIFITDLFKSVNINNIEDAFIICILHEFGHAHRNLIGDENYEKYLKDVDDLTAWYLRSSNTYENKIEYNKRYRNIEEEKCADEFAVENYEKCKAFLKEKKLIYKWKDIK